MFRHLTHVANAANAANVTNRSPWVFRPLSVHTNTTLHRETDVIFNVFWDNSRMNRITPTEPALPSNDSTSVLLKRTLNELDSEHVSVGMLLSSMSQRSFGSVIVILSILGLIPGISVGAGASIFLLSVQLIRGRITPSLPGILANKQIRVSSLKKTLNTPIKLLDKLEKLIKPRWIGLASGTALRWVGVVMAILALVMITPFPLSNLFPAISLFLIALGLMEKDGYLTLIGLLSSLLSVALAALVIKVGYALFLRIFNA